MGGSSDRVRSPLIISIVVSLHCVCSAEAFAKGPIQPKNWVSSPCKDTEGGYIWEQYGWQINGDRLAVGDEMTKIFCTIFADPWLAWYADQHLDDFLGMPDFFANREAADWLKYGQVVRTAMAKQVPKGGTVSKDTEEHLNAVPGRSNPWTWGKLLGATLGRTEALERGIIDDLTYFMVTKAIFAWRMRYRYSMGQSDGSTTLPPNIERSVFVAGRSDELQEICDFFEKEAEYSWKLPYCTSTTSQANEDFGEFDVDLSGYLDPFEFLQFVDDRLLSVPMWFTRLKGTPFHAMSSTGKTLQSGAKVGEKQELAMLRIANMRYLQEIVGINSFVTVEDSSQEAHEETAWRLACKLGDSMRGTITQGNTDGEMERKSLLSLRSTGFMPIPIMNMFVPTPPCVARLFHEVFNETRIGDFKQLSILVHCGSGQGRTGNALLLLLMYAFGISADEAMPLISMLYRVASFKEVEHVLEHMADTSGFMNWCALWGGKWRDAGKCDELKDKLGYGVQSYTSFLAMLSKWIKSGAGDTLVLDSHSMSPTGACDPEPWWTAGPDGATTKITESAVNVHPMPKALSVFRHYLGKDILDSRELPLKLAGWSRGVPITGGNQGSARSQGADAEDKDSPRQEL